VQDDAFGDLHSVVLCPLTTTEREGDLIRPRIVASRANGLTEDSFVMTDKLVGTPRARIAQVIGRLGQAEMEAVDLALITLLGLS
jgi:mRNA interferase MazF